MTILYAVGFFRTILIIVGVIVVMRFIGRLMIAKRNIEEHERLNKAKKAQDQMREKARRNFGKTTISKLGKSKYNDGDFVDYEEIKED
jgi:uncharacterized membrane protein